MTKPFLDARQCFIMKNFVLWIIMGLISVSICLAADPLTGKGLVMPVEFRAGNVLTAVGKLEYTGDSLEIVEFTAGASGRVLVAPYIYVIIDKTVLEKGVHRIKGANQNGIIATGTIDFRDLQNPKVYLTTESGQTIVTISPEGQKLKGQIVPKIKLGVE